MQEVSCRPIGSSGYKRDDDGRCSLLLFRDRSHKTRFFESLTKQPATCEIEKWSTVIAAASSKTLIDPKFRK